MRHAVVLDYMHRYPCDSLVLKVDPATSNNNYCCEGSLNGNGCKNDASGQ